MNNNYTNLEEIIVGKRFGYLYAFEYKGNNSAIKRIEKIARYLQLRKDRANNAKRRKEGLKLIAKGQFEKGNKLLTPVWTKKMAIGEIQQARAYKGSHFISLGQKFRIPDSKNGIEDYFEVEYKKVEN